MGRPDQVTLVKVSEQFGKIGGLESKEVFGSHRLNHPVEAREVEKLKFVFVILTPPALELVRILGTRFNIVGRVDVGGDTIMVEEKSELGWESVFAGQVVDDPIHLVKVGSEVGVIILDYHRRTSLPTFETTGFYEGKIELHMG